MAEAMARVPMFGGAPPGGAAGPMPGPAAPAGAPAGMVVAAPVEKVVEGKEEPPPELCAKPDFNFTPVNVDWCEKNAPALADAQLAKLKAGGEVWFFRNLLGYYKLPGVIASLPWWACIMFGPKPGKWGLFVTAIPYVFATIPDIIFGALIKTRCDANVMTPLIIQSASLGVMERWVGVDFGPARLDLTNTMNYACPTLTPLPSHVVAAYLHDTLVKEKAVAWCKVASWCPYTTELAIDAEKWRPDTQTVCQWYYRGCIVSEPEAMRALRQQGVLEPSEQRAILECNRPLIGVNEAIHWYYVLRAGRTDKELAYSYEECKADIKKHGYTDLQARRFIESSHALLGVRHILQPFYEGRIQESSMRQALKDNRWRDEDIDLLMPFYEFKQNETFAREIGAPDSKALVDDYAGGLVQDDIFVAEMRVLGNRDAVIFGAVQETNARIQRDVRVAGIKAVHADYMSGELNDTGVIEALARFDVRGPSAISLAETWLLERSIRNKPANLGELCDWYSRGLLSLKEYAYRLNVMGRSAADAERVVRVCADKERVRQEKLQEAADKQRARDEAKRQAAAAKVQSAKTSGKPAAGKAASASSRNAKGQFMAQAKEDIATAAKVGASVKSREDASAKGKIQSGPGPVLDESQLPQ